MSYQNVKNSRERLKKRMVYVMGDKCQCCGYDKCISALEFHHINPDEKSFTFSANTNRGWATIVPELKKCVLVCANCHREIEAGLIESPSSSFNQERADEIFSLLEDLKTHKIYYCKDCGMEISANAERCVKCSHLFQRRIERPSKEELKQMIRIKPFTQIAQQFKVSDNAVRKWCDSYGLPRKKTEINSYSDEEWDLI